jgi:uncharacterized protein (DUF362 family)
LKSKYVKLTWKISLKRTWFEKFAKFSHIATDILQVIDMPYLKQHRTLKLPYILIFKKEYFYDLLYKEPDNLET